MYRDVWRIACPDCLPTGLLLCFPVVDLIERGLRDWTFSVPDRGAAGLWKVSGDVFFVSVNRLVRIWACRNSGLV
jgi:hypothetical protein